MDNLKKLLFRTVLAISLIAPMLSSCVNLDEVWNKIGSIEAQLDSIKNDLNVQAEALSSLMANDDPTISSCTKNEDGSYLVKLSNGTEFTVLPAGADVSALIAYTFVDGVKCWATYDATGTLVPLKGADGKPVPVEASISVDLIDGVYYLVVNGKKFQTGYDTEDIVSVFSSCEALTDASGQVYAMTFTFGDGQKVTVTVDGYKGVIFKLSNAGTLSAVSEYYVDYGKTMRFLMDVEGVIDYVMQIPDGWRVSEIVDELTGETYVDITAPAEAVVAAGAAVAKGDLKVVSVVEGGKAAVTRLSLSADPFKTYNVSPVKAVIEPYNGIEKFLYGLSDADTFDKTQHVAQLNGLLGSSNDLPEGFFISEQKIDKTIAEIYGAEIPEGSNLVFWAVPALYSEGDKDEEAGYYTKEEMLRTLMISPVFVKIEVSDATVFDANLKVSVKGAEEMYAGTVIKTDSILDEIIYRINNGGVDPVNYSLTYDGPASEFPAKDASVSMEPGTTYISWVVPVENDKDEYMVSDVIYKEFTTLSVQAGGTLKVNVGEPVSDCSSISASVASEGAAMIYYAWLNDSEGKRISQTDNETMYNKILASDSFTIIEDASGTATIDYIKPETTMWLFTVAVGADGKYGEITYKSATTESVSFNSLSVSVSNPVVTVNGATFTITVSDGTPTDFIYWCGKETDPFWLYEEYCNGSRLDAEVYMAANPDAEVIQNVMKKNGKVASDGTLTITDLQLNSTYVFMILAQDETGKYSKGTMKKFNTPAADLGDVVATGSEKWETTKKWIEDNIIWHEDKFEPRNGMMSASYAFDIKVPTDLTAYICCYGTQATNTIDIILEIEKDCMKMTSSPRVVTDENGELPTHPDYYDDNGKFIQGSLVNAYDFYPHGSMKGQNVAFTFFSANGHSEIHCDVWEGGKCSNYEHQKKEIEKFMSYDYWKERVIDEGNYAYEGDPNHEYSRTLTDPEKIDALAKAYQELYTKYYKDTEPILYINDGNSLPVINRQGFGVDEKGNVIDRVTVVLKDEAGNYYEPMYIEVPNYFQ